MRENNNTYRAKFIEYFNAFEEEIKEKSNAAIANLEDTKKLLENAPNKEHATKYIEKIDECIRTITPNLYNRQNKMYTKFDSPALNVQYTPGEDIMYYLRDNVPGIEHLMRNLSEEFSTFQTKHSQAELKNLEEIAKSVKSYEQSLVNVQKAFEKFIDYAATGKELDQKKAQGMLNKIKEACQFFLRDFDKFIAAIQDFFDKVQEKVFGVPRARLEEEHKNLDVKNNFVADEVISEGKAKYTAQVKQKADGHVKNEEERKASNSTQIQRG
ncbi:hypothetical protein [Candidatus Lariskella endosymbiont of Epinotia ramella]|uniref:hypothetical protein n=1 Tax=Candidatus Lariskella endosymbiont of Epinotia ramella TaxID=3066224 RepID=UPI0030D1B8B6